VSLDLDARALILAVAVGVILWQGLAAWLRPRCSVTVQKTVDINNAPEVVTVSLNRWRWGKSDDRWMDAERAGLVATARMTSINHDILEQNAADAERIAARKAERDAERDARITGRQKKKIARLKGIKVDEVTPAMVAEAVATAKAQRNGTLEPVS